MPEGFPQGSYEVCSAERVSRALDDLATQAAAALADANPIVLAVMNGGVFTAVELCRRFRFAYEFDYVHATRYGDKLTGGELKWLRKPAVDLSGRVVLIVDDILDRGQTLQAVQQSLDSAGAAQVLTAVLVRKTLSQGQRACAKADFTGLDADDVYLFGCGMDYAGQWRGLPALYALESAT